MRKQLLLPLALGLATSCATRQRDNAPADKIRMLYEALAACNKAQALANRRMLKDTHEMLKHGGQPASRRLDARCDTIHSATTRLLALLRATRGRLRTEAGNSNVYNSTAVMLAEGGPAHILLQAVSAYSAKLCQLTSEQSPLRLLPPTVSSETQPDEIAAYYFANASLPETFAALSQIEYRILAFEAEALQLQQEQIGCGGNSVPDAVGAFANVESNTVPVGSTYRAELQLVRTMTPEPVAMSVDGRSIAVDAYGRGRVEFQVGVDGLHKKNKVTKMWTGAIKTRFAGRDTTYKVLVPYTVVRSPGVIPH